MLLAYALSAALIAPHLPTQAGQGAPDPQKVTGAIDAGVAFLKGVATANGGRQLDSANQRAGLRALVLYTLLKGGMAATDPIADDLLFGLTEDTIDQTYDAACLILALEAHDALAHRAWIEALAQKLVDWQEPDGAWSYPGLVIDLSNTQYAALGLWAASKAGVDVPVDVWLALARGTFEYQADGDGGFSYTAPPGGSTGSMTTAGVGVLAICEQELALRGALDAPFAHGLAERRRRGVAWLAERFAVDTNPALGGHHYYYLYGLERMGALTGLTRIGTHDWYAEGASYLVGAQETTGAWLHGSDLADTCFAVLFLERATGRGKSRVPMSGPKREADRTLDVDAEVRVGCKVEHGVAVAHVAALSPTAVQPYLWPGEADRGPRVRRVEYLIGGTPAGVALGAPERPAEDEAFAAFVRPRAPGDLVARVHLVPPPGSSDLAPYLESPPLTVEWPNVLATSEVARGAEALAPRPRLKASSELTRSKLHPERDYGGENAVDGNPATPWLTKPGDRDPSLRVQPRSDTRALGVTLSLPVLPGRAGAPIARPTKVEVVVNGKSKEALTADLAPFGRTRVLFAAPMNVKSVEVRILETDAAPRSDKDKDEREPGPPTGLGEVGLIGAPTPLAPPKRR